MLVPLLKLPRISSNITEKHTPFLTEDSPGYSQAPPNIVLIVTDDHPNMMDENSRPLNMPYLASLDNTIVFRNAYTPCSICTPARISLLTGVYAGGHTGAAAGDRVAHGATKNGYAKRLERDGFFENLMYPPLKEAGYQTAHFGKVANGVKSRILPGVDTTDVRGTNPNIVFPNAAEWIRQQQDATGQIAVSICTTAPHNGVKPTSWAKQIEPVFPELTPDIGHTDPYKPDWWQRMYGRGNPDTKKQQAIKRFYSRKVTQRYQTLYDVDAGIQEVIAALKETGRYDNTVIIITADHGIGDGSHNIGGKGGDKAAPYGRFHNVPLLIHWPGHESAVIDQHVSLLDVNATIHDLSNTLPMLPPDGASLVPLVKPETTEAAQTQWDEERFYVIQEKHPDRNKGFSSFGVRTNKWVTTFYPDTAEIEYYDLMADPYELNNLGSRPTLLVAANNGTGQENVVLAREILDREYWNNA